jgi:hypothetical protein
MDMQVVTFLKKVKEAPYSATTVDQVLAGINAGTYDGMEAFQSLDRMEAMTTTRAGYFKAKRR